MKDLRAFSSNYLESIAKTPLTPGKTTSFDKPEMPSFLIPGRKKNGDGPSRGLEGDSVPLHCGKWAVVGRCECGRQFAKSLSCGREWCTRCRKSAHGRRMARWLSKAQKMGVMGYLVVTFPEDKRPRTKKALGRIGRLITRALVRRGFDRGLRRWHFFGEQPFVWHPHLNFLFESGYLDDEKLESLKRAIRGILKLDEAVIYYQYSEAVNQKIHWIKYVTRPTFLRKKWDVVMAAELRNFRNCVSWGKWEDKDKWSFPAAMEKTLSYRAKIERGICPVCDSKIQWSRPVKIDELFDRGFEEIWAGLWQERPPPEKVLEFEFFKKLDRINRNN